MLTIHKLARYTNNQYYDYGFVETNSSYIPTNTLVYPSTGITKLAVLNYCPSITVNMAIAKSGPRTAYTSGKVTGTDYDDDVVLTGMVTSDVEGNQGDSGGGQGILGIGRAMYSTSINDLPGALQTGVY